MKVLLYGNADSIWIKQFVEFVLLPLKCEIYLCLNCSGNRFDEYYKENGVKYLNIKKGITDLVPKVRVVSRIIKSNIAIKKQGFDKVIIIEVTPEALYSIRGGFSNKDVFTYFSGSDMIRVTGLRLYLLKRLLLEIKPNIICGSKKVLEEYYQKIGNIMNPSIIRFGIPQFEQIKKLKREHENKYYKKKFGIPSNTISIFIGYNASAAQQHIQVIKELEKLPPQYRDMITIVLPMGYCIEKPYFYEVKDCVKISNLNCIIIEDFLDIYNSAMLRLATDVFINAQITDSLSASVLESYYAGSRVLSGKWLEYPDLEENGISYETFEDFEELYFKVLQLLENNNKDEIRNSETSKVYDLLSLDRFFNDWKNKLV